jgi:hypothetical protein
MKTSLIQACDREIVPCHRREFSHLSTIGTRRRETWKVSPFEIFLEFIHFEMAPITVLEHAFSFPRHVGSISRKTINLLQKLSFNGESKISASHHLSDFNLICNHLHVFDERLRSAEFLLLL